MGRLRNQPDILIPSGRSVHQPYIEYRHTAISGITTTTVMSSRKATQLFKTVHHNGLSCPVNVCSVRSDRSMDPFVHHRFAINPFNTLLPVSV
jgi:hypothetical protein